MKSHETRLASGALGAFVDDIKPVVQAGGSDTATLDNVFELLVRGGRDAPMAKALMIPPSIGNDATMPKAHRDLFLYCNAVMEPWDGPAAIAATDGRWVIAGLDRNGLRPLRYTVTNDAMLIVGSETGMVKLNGDNVAEKGRVGPGQTIGVDLESSRFYRDEQLKDTLAARHSFGDWTKRIVQIDSIVKTDAPEPVLYEGEELRRRQLAVGFTLEELEMILHPMVEEGARGGRQHGRRHADRGVVYPLSRPAPLLPASVQSGDEPADRQPARNPRHDAEDPARQSRQRAGRGCEPVRPAATRKPGALERRVRRHARVHGRFRLRGGLHLPRRRRRSRAARRARAHPAGG